MLKMAKRQTLHIWIALLAVLFSALAPAVSSALAATDTVQVCTVDGYKIVKLPGADKGKAPASAKHAMEHCAFCSLHADAHPLPGAPSVPLALDAGRDTYPPLFYTAPRTLHTWSAANPRAPPFPA
ncbi:DUF2946 domain-containing protein [Rugamonas sp. FT82W]|uniref:DUF2946 domain-containing protein n=1 Tax=Duganella vulcania TaxID=2692166 RepID=A0A845G3Y9_9BURK|nr:DUF2946 domain-containing protein [Duganella vulcania]MYM88125.1 DUF2946 domain-containing protein [Duganella vulcania]